MLCFSSHPCWLFLLLLLLVMLLLLFLLFISASDQKWIRVRVNGPCCFADAIHPWGYDVQRKKQVALSVPELVLAISEAEEDID